MANKPESTLVFLDNTTFRELRNRIGIHAELLKEIVEILPSSLAEHCRYCVLGEKGRLVIFTDSPVWSSQLRFHTASILSTLRTGGKTEISQIAIRQVPMTSSQWGRQQKGVVKTPHPRSIEAVNSCSRSVEGDELREALSRLGAAMESYARKRV